MKKLFANLFSAFSAGFLGAWGSGMPAKQALIVAALAAASNVSGLLQTPPTTSAPVEPVAK